MCVRCQDQKALPHLTVSRTLLRETVSANASRPPAAQRCTNTPPFSSARRFNNAAPLPVPVKTALMRILA